MSIDQLLAAGYVPFWETVLRLVLAAVLGMTLGLDRELKNKPIGIKGFTLVALGAAGFSILALELLGVPASEDRAASIDPSRAIQGVIAGIGFLGAGAIIHRESRVQGTSTGAGIWLAGAIGAACGFGLYPLATAITVIGVVILVLVGLVQRLLSSS